MSTAQLLGAVSAPPTIDDILAGLERMERLVFESDSFFIRYERTSAVDLVASCASGGFLPAEWVQAYRGSKWYSQRRFTRPFKTKELLVAKEPRTEIIKEGCLLEWNQEHGLAVVDRFGQGRNIYAGLYYTRNLSLDAPKFIARSNGADIRTIRTVPQYADWVALPFLPEFLREHRDQYTVLPEPEIIDGAECWIVEWPGMDRFWVDPKLGFAVPRRAYSWGPGKPLRFEFRQRDYREVKSGLWLPFSQTEDYYASVKAEKESLWGQVTSRCEYVIHVLELDRVSDDLFNPTLPPGTRVIDCIRGMEYATSVAGADPFAAPFTEA